MIVAIGCHAAAEQGVVAADLSHDATPGFLKGQLHTHTSRSGDSETTPEDVARWYAERGYDFIVLTDHNRITTVVDPPNGMLVVPGIELTFNLPHCVPPPEPGLQCLLHVNALFVDPERSVEAPPLRSDDRLAVYRHAIGLAHALGGIAQLDHPNFHWAADADVLVALAADGLELFEVANLAIDSANEGDASHPSTEALWDAALARGARLFGTATDDAHHYDDADDVRARGEVAHVGDRGFVMVRAARDPGAIRDALARGDFYGSNGLLLRDVQCRDGVLEVSLLEASTVECIGGRSAPQTSHAVECRAASDGSPVRAVVRDGSGRTAWTQPCWPQ